jgi:uracil-DNA glycosylase
MSKELLDAVRRAVVPGAFNQYAEQQAELDRADAVARRLANLGHYLELFAAARYLLVGEAAGYAACRFSGVPFTDERLLVGPEALAWAGLEQGFQRCSRDERPLLREASAQVVWGALGSRRDVALWNVVPWHPYGVRGPLSNALPSRAARRAGLEVLRLVLATLWREAEPIAVGRVAEQALRELDLAEPTYLRHPGHGGSGAFRAGLPLVCPRA